MRAGVAVALRWGVLAGLLLPLGAGCSKSRPPCYVVSGKQAQEMLKPGTMLLDVRTHEEHSHGRVEGAVHIPLEELDYRMKYVPVGTRIVVFSHKGRRASEAAKRLRRVGYEVYELGPIADLDSDEDKCKD